MEKELIKNLKVYGGNGLHAFRYILKDIDTDKVADQGFKYLQITCLQPLEFDDYDKWTTPYLPTSIDKIGNQYGSEKDLADLCERSHKKGVIVIPDVVFCHVAGQGPEVFEPSARVDRDLAEDQAAWREKKLITNWEDVYDTTHHCTKGLPGLNLYNPEVQERVLKLLHRYQELGVDGFRVDSGKQIPVDGDFLKNVFGDAQVKEGFNYFEMPNASYERMQPFFEYGKVLTEGKRNDERLVGFYESHDTFYNNGPMGYTRQDPDWKTTQKYGEESYNDPFALYFARNNNNTWQSQEVKQINQSKPKCYCKVA